VGRIFHRINNLLVFFSFVVLVPSSVDPSPEPKQLRQRADILAPRPQQPPAVPAVELVAPDR
jgi:hypothetical protein